MLYWAHKSQLPTKNSYFQKKYKQTLDSKLISESNSNPRGQIAQSVEQRIENPRVGGSIPPLATM
ncbi:protein of unknown function [Legionella fallonii LLAP-10]|uniref:Uncharacterized protein n=1 Tax=Legionella fallonii LLAP-10 TaxID=1212491 RepID=A0A098G6E1_9GAMM|nr:protein of unknown function [Legionella fallonii LLAP-10]